MHTTVFAYTCDDLHTGRLIFEPWGNEYDVAPEETLRFIAQSPEPGKFELCENDEFAVLFLWPGATCEVYRGEVRLDVFDTPVPPVPKGMNLREFMEMVFDDPD